MKLIYALSLVFISSACTITQHHGNEAPTQNLSKLKVGLSTQKQVTAALGSPNYVSADGKRLWLYISRKTSALIPTFETEIERRVVGIYFNKRGTMAGRRIWTLADGQDLDFIPEIIASPIPELNWIQRLFSNIGRVTPAGVPQGQGP